MDLKSAATSNFKPTVVDISSTNKKETTAGGNIKEMTALRSALSLASTHDGGNKRVQLTQRSSPPRGFDSSSYSSADCHAAAAAAATTLMM